MEHDADGRACRWTNGQALVRHPRMFLERVTIGVKVVWQMRYWV